MKKGFIFTVLFSLAMFIYSNTLGGILGWFATEDGIVSLAVAFAIISLAIIILLTKPALRKITKNEHYNLRNAIIFEIPYCILFILWIVVILIIKSKNIITETEFFICQILCPMSYISDLLYWIFDFSFVSRIILSSIVTIIHLFFVSFFLIKQGKEKA